MTPPQSCSMAGRPRASRVEGVHKIIVGSESVVFEVENAQAAPTGFDGYPYESVFIGLTLVILIQFAYRKSQNMH